jgi:monomeric isocitrate dehydrogenase
VREQQRREQVHRNEEVTKRISELEAKLQESDRDRKRLRAEKDAISAQVQELAQVNSARGVQESIVEVLRRSQEAMEAAN